MRGEDGQEVSKLLRGVRGERAVTKYLRPFATSFEGQNCAQRVEVGEWRPCAEDQDGPVCQAGPGREHDGRRR